MEFKADLPYFHPWERLRKEAWAEGTEPWQRFERPDICNAERVGMKKDVSTRVSKKSSFLQNLIL